PQPTPVPSLLDIQDAPVDELIGENWDRPPHRVPIGVDDDLGIVLFDVLRTHRPHGLLTGPRHLRDPLLRTLVFGLALRHSPNVVNFAFADFSRGMSFVGLGSLPHVVTAVHPTSADSPLLSRFPDVLETERRRREAVLQNTGTPWWDDYQAAVAGDGSLDPLPALIVIIDNAGPLLETRSDLIEPIVALSRKCPAQGIRLVFCSPDDAALPPELDALVSWTMRTPGVAGPPGSASLHVPGEMSLPGFRPAHISLDVADPIVERMRERARRARRLPWPDDAAPPPAPSEPSPLDTAAPPPAVPRFDVLKLNGGGASGMFEETWARPALDPRDPAIGYDPDGEVVTLYPLDISAGIPHGLIVGETEARQHVLRNIALALASCYSPGDLTFAFGGAGAHPLGEPLDLPHVAFSDAELLGRPQRLREFTEYLSGELESRIFANSTDAPGLLVFADLPSPSSLRSEGPGVPLELVRRGPAFGVQFLFSVSTVEDTTEWERVLSLFGWRVAADRLPPAVLQRVLGQANLPFPDEHTAYLSAGSDGPRRFTLAPDPPRPAIDDFVQRTQRHWAALSGQAIEPSFDASILDAMVEELPDRVPHVEQTPDHEYKAIDTGKVTNALREILVGQAEESRDGRPPGLRHLIFPAPYVLEMTTVARLYGDILGEHGLLTQGNLITLSSGRSAWNDDPHSTIAPLYRGSQGSVVLVHDARGVTPDASYLRPEVIRRLINVMEEEHEDALLVLCGDAARFSELLRTVPGFAERFRWVTAMESGTRSEATGDPAVAEVLRQLHLTEKQARPPDERLSRHIVYGGTDGPRIARLAAEYGRMLAELGVLSHGDVLEGTADWLGHVAGEPGRTMADLFRESRGGVLLLHMAREAIAPAEAEAVFPERLRALVQEHGEDPVVIVCADAGQMIGLRRFDPHFTDRYRRLLEFPKVTDASTPPDEPAEAEPPPDLPELIYVGELPAVTDRRIPIGVAGGTREPVYVDFDADPHLLVAGPPGSGRANALQLLLDGISAREGVPEAEIHVFDAHEILLSLAEEYGLTEAAGPGVGYTDSAAEFRETVDGLVRRPPDAEVFLFVIDRDLDDDPLRALPRDVLTSSGHRIHLVLARLLTVLDQPVDPMVSTLHEMGAPALLLGHRYGEENRLYGAEPPGGPGVVGRGVLVRGGRRHVLQVAHASPFA
ncbi:FtsK/SpoIIIE domain-containing protein, partial [Actinomadura sp. 6K520]|uniref:FtsK/SpoIIIE domain-containing protein n=1 Tax=Actinomadura sp. 6K520 TaxID=2530364 RepID=UPI00105173AB